MKIKIMAHNVNVKFVDRFKERNDLMGQHDSEEKTIIVQCQSDSGNIRPLSALLVTFFHEIGHEIDDSTGHETFCSEDDDTRKMKEGALEAFANGLVQVLMDNKMLAKEWIEKFRKEIP